LTLLQNRESFQALVTKSFTKKKEAHRFVCCNMNSTEEAQPPLQKRKAPKMQPTTPQQDRSRSICIQSPTDKLMSPCSTLLRKKKKNTYFRKKLAAGRLVSIRLRLHI